MDRNKTETIKVLAKHRLSKNKYVFELSNCLVVVTTDDNGEIVRAAMFGDKQNNHRKGVRE